MKAKRQSHKGFFYRSAQPDDRSDENKDIFGGQIFSPPLGARTHAQNANLSPSKGHFILPWKWPDLGRGEEGVIAVVSILLPPLNSDSVSVRSNVSRAFARLRPPLKGRLFLLKEGWRGASNSSGEGGGDGNNMNKTLLLRGQPTVRGAGRNTRPTWPLLNAQLLTTVQQRNENAFMKVTLQHACLVCRSRSSQFFKPFNAPSHRPVRVRKSVRPLCPSRLSNSYP